ncbi:STAS domain-containing protein [Cerasicoccus fimbriatus]|uniref:STAS domain-containing protein n=1 Tax=Cerasicoccus fimbriatus TaxID=3014554 RepID=UPI0022B5665F|nr:STAS domain-containing protein [Cerasicoccus sp. TK19100]
MPETESPVFLIDAYSEPVILRIQGRASFLNCAPVRDFFDRVAEMGKRSVVIDFQDCTGMDSTFLGIMAGAALEFRKLTPPGDFTLVRLSQRNLELVRNLGLHRIMNVETGDFDMAFNQSDSLKNASQSEKDNAEMVLKAHECLVEADSSNQKKFQDVLSFLRLQVDKDTP